MTTLKTPNTEIIVNKLSFLSVTHTVTTDVRFDSYKFSKTGHGAKQIMDKLDIEANSQI
jgi:uncharacterized protein (AIM24 family)